MAKLAGWWWGVAFLPNSWSFACQQREVGGAPAAAAEAPAPAAIKPTSLPNTHAYTPTSCRSGVSLAAMQVCSWGLTRQPALCKAQRQRLLLIGVGIRGGDPQLVPAATGVLPRQEGGVRCRSCA